MQKNIKVIALFLMLIFILAGCTNKSETTKANESIVEENQTSEIEVIGDSVEDSPVFGSYEDAEELKSVEEDKSLLKEKEEFMQLFKKFCGFSLPEYFFIPKVTDETNWNRVFISERYISVIKHFIVHKNDALDMLGHLRNDNSWGAYYDMAYRPAMTQEERNEKCNLFEKTRHQDISLGGQGIRIYFIYDKDNDFYIMEMHASLQRDPPPGTSWPEEMYS